MHGVALLCPLKLGCAGALSATYHTPQGLHSVKCSALHTFAQGWESASCCYTAPLISNTLPVAAVARWLSWRRSARLAAAQGTTTVTRAAQAQWQDRGIDTAGQRYTQRQGSGTDTAGQKYRQHMDSSRINAWTQQGQVQTAAGQIWTQQDRGAYGGMDTAGQRYARGMIQLTATSKTAMHAEVEEQSNS